MASASTWGEPMGRRKKKKSTASRKRNTAESDGLGTLGDLLGRRAEPRRSESSQTTGTAKTTTASAAAESSETTAPTARRLTASDLMAEAFEAAGDAALWEAKFEGRGYDARDVEVVDGPNGDSTPTRSSAEATGPTMDAMTPEERMFLDAMGGEVQRLDDRDRYADLTDHSFVGASWRDEVELTRLSADELMVPTLTAEQRETLKRSRRDRLPTLNIRHMNRSDALTSVDVFVRTNRIDGHRFVRIIHGKGRQSVGEPVLKRAVLDWCGGDGGLLVKRWAPETDRSGNFGCVVLELRLSGRAR